MAERRPLSSFVSGDFDSPPATITLAADSMTRLDRLGRALERQREQTERQTARRREILTDLQASQRRRFIRSGSTHPPTYEGRNWTHDDYLPGDSEHLARHAKRRKLELTADVGNKTHKYGHYGQVEPGMLKMRIHSCDGGVHHDRAYGYYGETNILDNNTSVYSSKEPHCNIVLQHFDSTSFTLTSVTITAPKDHFTAPIRKGLLAIAMDTEDLLSLTYSPLDFQEDPKADAEMEAEAEAETQLAEIRDEERLGLLESLSDLRVLAAASATHNDDSWPPPADWLPQPLPPVTSRDRRRDGRIWNIRAGGSWPPLQPSEPLTITRPRQARTAAPQEQITVGDGFNVTLDQDHETGTQPSDPAGLPQARTSGRSIGDMWVTSGPNGWSWSTFDSARSPEASQRASAATQPFTSGFVPRPMTPPPADRVTQVPFQIKDGRHSVTISFDPPVAATSILLRCQSGSKRPNVDIQSVIACGYAGPRYFPAVTMK